MINWIIIFSRQGKLRLRRWFLTTNLNDKMKTIMEVIPLVLSRKQQMCNFIEFKDHKLVYRKYASLYFCFCVTETENELLMMEIIHRYVQCLDTYFGSVCELDIIHNMTQCYAILDEFIINGELLEPLQKYVLKAVRGAESYEVEEELRQNL
ncbi:Adaptor protein complex sigma subunit, partial [Gorgonomyces haynaldii]